MDDRDDKSGGAFSRRELLTGMLGLVAAGGAAGLAGCDGPAIRKRGETMADPDKTREQLGNSRRMPVGYVAHGAPTLVFDKEKGADLTRWADQMPRPRAILVVSAHWQDTPVTIGTTRARELMYDFRGFPKELYEVDYDAPAAPQLADRVAALLETQTNVLREDRPLDHGVWVPLVHMAPGADVPVLQLSMPTNAGAQGLFELGQQLAPLRDEGVLLLGSGNLVHNLRRLDWSESQPPASWAAEFDQWAAETLAARDFDTLVDYRAKSPALRIAHPTDEHFQPVLIAAGAASGGEAVSFPVEGFEYGNISRRCVQFG